MIYVVAFILAIVILVTVHEFAHFYTAKKLGIKVLEFSIGMGPCIAKRTGKDGVIYKICAFPVGGYVNMLDESNFKGDESYTDEELSRAFNRQTLWKRALVVVNGPISNLVLAFVLFFFIGLSGITTFKPVIGDVSSGGWAEHEGFVAGDIISKVEGQGTDNWSHAMLSLVKHIGDSDVAIQIKRNGQFIDKVIDMDGFTISNKKDPFVANGFIPYHMFVAPVIDTVLEDSPASNAGLMKDDKIVSIDGELIHQWKDMSFNDGSKEYVLEVKRDEGLLDLKISPEIYNDKYSIGVTALVEPMPKEYLYTTDANILDGLTYSIRETWLTASATLLTLPKIFTQDIPLDALSGPIGIGKVTGQALQAGYIAFLYILSVLSVSLFIVNILPIPCLDGGHLSFYAVEFVRGKPLSKKVEKAISTIGALSLYAIFIVVIINDIGAL